MDNNLWNNGKPQIRNYGLTIFALVAFFTLPNAAIAQESPVYLVRFRDKANSTFSVERPQEFLSERALARRMRQNIAISENDLPVNQEYLAAVKGTGAVVLYASKWFNGAAVEATDEQLKAIRALPFFNEIEKNGPIANLEGPTPGLARQGVYKSKLEQVQPEVDHGRMRAQLELLGILELHEKGVTGEGMLISVMDAGFPAVDTLGFFQHLRDSSRIVDSYNFVSREENVYQNHNHGTNVLSTIAAYKPGALVGAAYDASFALYRTENELSETPYEEVTWLIAAERADSLGTDIITTSLSYNTFEGPFDTPEYNYTYEEMDGKTTIISKAAQIAASKGILLVNAAGNEGSSAWKYIAAPADGDSVIAVGAVDYELRRGSISSIGPSADGRTKPDVAAVGIGTVLGILNGGTSTGSGTSYAAPQIAGLCALLWQGKPFLTAKQVADVLRKSGSQADNPDNLLGFGVPKAMVAEEIIEEEHEPLGIEPEVRSLVFPNPADNWLNIVPGPKLKGRNATMSIFSPSGNSMYESEGILKELEIIKLRNLAPGLYFLRITAEDQSRVYKFIKR